MEYRRIKCASNLEMGTQQAGIWPSSEVYVLLIENLHLWLPCDTQELVNDADRIGRSSQRTCICGCISAGVLLGMNDRPGTCGVVYCVAAFLGLNTALRVMYLTVDAERARTTFPVCVVVLGDVVAP